MAYLLSVLTTYIFDGELRTMFNMFRIDQQIRSFKDHVIVCGFGRNGSKAYYELHASGAQVVIVERDETLLKTVNEASDANILAVFGDATDDDTLLAAGVARARALITALPKDADNVFVALTARELNPDIKIIARASLKSSEHKLLRAANRGQPPPFFPTPGIAATARLSAHPCPETRVRRRARVRCRRWG